MKTKIIALGLAGIFLAACGSSNRSGEPTNLSESATASENVAATETPNKAPIIQTKSLPPANEDENYAAPIEVSDPDGDLLSLFVNNGPEGLTLSAADNALHWRPTQKDVGTHHVTVIAVDPDGSSTEQTFELEVLNVNDPPTIAIQDQFVVDEGQPLTLEPVVEDEDGDALEVTYGGWMNAAQKIAGYQDAGPQEVVITASDRQTSVQKMVTVTVNNINTLPTISGMDNLVFHEGDLIVLNPQIADVDGDSLLIRYSGWMNSNTKQTDHDDAGVYTITLLVSDGKVALRRSYSLTVLNVNRPPVFAEQQTIFNLAEGEYRRLSLEASDPDGDSVRYEVEGPAPDLVKWLDPASGRLFVRPALDGAGSFSVQVRAVDNGDPSASATLDLQFEVSPRWGDVRQIILRNTCGCDPKVDAGIVAFCLNQKIHKYEYDRQVYNEISGKHSSITTCPKTDNGTAVWKGITDDDDQDNAIFLHDGAQTNTIALSGREIDLQNGAVTWVDGETNRAEIFYYANGNTTQVSQNQRPDFQPKLNGGQILWISQKEKAGTLREQFSREVHFFDLPTQHHEILTDNLFEESSPAFGGPHMAWIQNDSDDPAGNEIIFFNHFFQPQRLTQNGVRDDSVHVADDGLVVWRQEGAAGGIYQFDGNAVRAVTDDGAADRDPMSQGGLVVWRRAWVDANGNPQYMVLAFRRGRVYVLDESGQNGPPATDGQIVVWRDMSTEALYGVTWE